VGAGAGGNDDSDRASRHHHEPVGFVDTLKLVSERLASGGLLSIDLRKLSFHVPHPGSNSLESAKRAVSPFFFIAMAGAVR
jgi:hypothetical protein